MFILHFMVSVFFSLPLSQGAEHPTFTTDGYKYRFEVLTKTKEVIWGFDFLKDGRIIFTERSGALKIFDPQKKIATSVTGVPKVWDKGQGGLLDVRVHPDDPNVIFFTYSKPVQKNGTTALARATLKNNQLTDIKDFVVAKEPNSETIHFGSRIEFDLHGHIFMTIGDRNKRPNAQSLAYHTGKILRLKMDGSVPSDNPFVNTKNALPEIWSYGHRSPQGLVRHPQTGELWESEMGPRGGDEINVIKPGLNYGWPLVSYGSEYYGPKISDTPTKPGVENPKVYWVPSISPSGISFYNGNIFSRWKGHLLIGNLSGAHLRKLTLQGDQIVHQEVMLQDLGLRLRNVRTGPEGYIYVSTDDGQLARLAPVL